TRSFLLFPPPATTQFSPLSLHDALPISLRNVMRHLEQVQRDEPSALPSVFGERRPTVDSSIAYLETLVTSYQRLSPSPNRRNCRSEEHTSELQSRFDLVCRLLLEKKKKR